jgi:hypothetical protein
MIFRLQDIIFDAWALIDTGRDGRKPRKVVALCLTQEQAQEIQQAEIDQGCDVCDIEKTRAVALHGYLIEAPGDLFAVASGKNEDREVMLKAKAKAAALAKLTVEEKALLGIEQ